MSEVERNVILKAGLVLVLMEGWTTATVVHARLGVAPTAALQWLVSNGFATNAQEAAGTLRWRPTRTFEELWTQLVPGRLCPVTLCRKPHRGARVKELQ